VTTLTPSEARTKADRSRVNRSITSAGVCVVVVVVVDSSLLPPPPLPSSPPRSALRRIIRTLAPCSYGKLLLCLSVLHLCRKLISTIKRSAVSLASRNPTTIFFGPVSDERTRSTVTRPLHRSERRAVRKASALEAELRRRGQLVVDSSR